MSCPITSNFTPNQLIKETADGSLCLYDTPEGKFILDKNEKPKGRKLICLSDIYACFRNNLDLKLEGCPRFQARGWNVFKMCRDV